MDWKSVNFDWNRARSFLLVATEGSLSAAARAMSVSQPTLGRQISALEHELGVTLFERLPNGLRITESGQNLVELVQQMSDAAEKFSLVASGHSQSLEGTVCVSASEIDAQYRLPAIAAKVRQLEPGIKLDIVVDNAVSNLAKREADIALRGFRPTQPDLIVKKLMDEPIWLYGSPQYLAAFANKYSPEDLSSLSVIGSDHNELMVKILNERGLKVTQDNIVVMSNSHLLHWALVKEKLGVGLFPQEIGDSEPAFVRAFESLGPIMTVPLWLVCHRELHTNSRIKRVFQIIADSFSKP